MNPLHLLWIIPITGMISFCFGAWLASGDDAHQDDEPDVCKRCMCLHCPYNPSMTNDEVM